MRKSYRKSSVYEWITVDRKNLSQFRADWNELGYYDCKNGGEKFSCIPLTLEVIVNKMECDGGKVTRREFNYNQTTYMKWD